MKSIDIANGIIFQLMDIKIDSFDERIISQKKIYLLQYLGTDLGYVYDWYLRGPYSPELSKYLYNKLDVLKNTDFSQYQLVEKPQSNVNIVNTLGDFNRIGISLSSWYELLASLVYINANKESWHIANKSELIMTLIKHKPQFNETQCKDALNTLKYRGINLVGIKDGQ